MKCDNCGAESDFEAGFVNERKSFRRTRRTLCRACSTKRRHSFEGWFHVAVLIGGVAGFLLLWRNPWSFAGHELITLFLIDLFLILSIVPHELGHAIVGRLVGWRVFAVVIGVGRRIFKFRLFGIIFSVHGLPICGVTSTAPIDTRWFRLKRFLVFIAGPMVNAIIAVVILSVWWRAWQAFGLMGLPLPARLCLWANLCVMAANLWPRESKTLNMATDGKQLLKTFSRKKEDVEELQAVRYAMEAMIRRDEYSDPAGALDWCNKGLALFPQNVPLLNMGGILFLDQQEYTRAREVFVQLLSRETKRDAATHYVILNNIAYVNALIGTPELLLEADSYSKEACGAIPWVSHFKGTRGTVLVALGQLEDGIKLLREAFECVGSSRSKAENACHLAIAYSRLSNRNEAEKFLKLAQQLDSKCRLIERAEAECQKMMQTAES